MGVISPVWDWPTVTGCGQSTGIRNGSLMAIQGQACCCCRQHNADDTGTGRGRNYYSMR
ncbi:MAG: hypothetical protein LPH21_00135 [Shewanella sp.]|nr:hypothetical protein [Shewanella sp.]